MPKLIIVNGTSGSGKTHMLETVASMYKNIVPIRKYTTRAERPYEDETLSKSLIFNCDINNITSCDFFYQFKKEFYGIKKSDMELTLTHGLNPIIIVRDFPTIIKLKSEYKDNLTFYIHSAYTGDTLINYLESKGRTNVKENIAMNKDTFYQYVEHLSQEIFDHIIINNYDETFLKQIKYYLRNI